ncbi:MAG: ribosome silencing factor [Desulfovibrio sp.]|jgi:ribosome-associated protein|nr:ribosome silencing factor [Desulfovibrio sp.]
MHLRIHEPESRLPSTATKALLLAGRLLEKKALDLLALDLSGEQLLYEAALIATASSPRHAKGLADFLLEECRRERFACLHLEGYAAAQWILLDLNDLVIHIFQQPIRDLYRLEDLWPAVPVLADHREKKSP